MHAWTLDKQCNIDFLHIIAYLAGTSLTGLMEDNLRDQLILQSVRPRHGADIPQQQSQFWMPNSQRQQPQQPQHSYNPDLNQFTGKFIKPFLVISHRLTCIE